MPPVSKLRLSMLLLILQLFLYLYVVPKDNSSTKQVDPGGGYPLEKACRVSYPPNNKSLSGRAYFSELSNNCGIRLERPPQVEVEEVMLEPEPEPPEPEPPQSTPTPILDQAVPIEDSSRSSSLIYQIIVVLLFMSVSFALADCFQERAKKKADTDRHNGLSRRMSLADLTMSRHARRESQASYRPIGVKHQPMVTRSCSHDIPTKSKPVSRQTSCPQLDEDAAAEKRRVRMIHRH